MDDSSGHNVWRSYSDMMSGLLLLFILIMAVCLLQAQKNYTEKLAEQALASQTQNQLEESQNTVAQQESELADTKAQLDEQASQLNEQQDQLARQTSALEKLQKELESKQVTLSERESELNASQSLIAQQESELASSQAQLDEANDLMEQQQARIDQIIGVKANLISALSTEFKNNNINVAIDEQTGAISLDASVLFDFNESVLTDAGKKALDQILPTYCSVLLSEEYAGYIAEIIIDGYADTTGDYITNLQLSQDRAYAVAQYLYDLRGSFLSSEKGDALLSMLTANGKSSSNPIMNEDGTVNDDASRRVEVKFRLKDEEMLEELQQLINESQTGTQTSTNSETAETAASPDADSAS
jgi:chemotaxis protein MotB